MEYLWIFLIILFIIIVIVLAAWWWNDNGNNDEYGSDIALSCNNVMSVINLDDKTYEVYVSKHGKTLNHVTLTKQGESTICRPSGEFMVVITSDKHPVLNITSASLTSYYVVLSQGHFYTTNSLSKGKTGNINLYNTSKRDAKISITADRSAWQAVVNKNDVLESSSEYYHEYTDPRKEFVLQVWSDGQEGPVHREVINGRDNIIVNITGNGIKVE